MGVFKRKNGKWAIQFQHQGKTYTCYCPDGTREGFSKRAEAIVYEPLFRSKVLAEPKKSEVIVNEALCEDFFAWMEKKLKPSTYYGYIGTFNKYWKSHVVGLNIMEFDNNFIEATADKLFRRKQNWNGKSAVGKLFVKFCKKFNPMLDPDVIREPRKVTPHVKTYSIYTAEEFEKFFSVIEDHRDQFLFLLLFRYGLRISECLGLMWSDFKKDGVHIDRCACIKSTAKGVIFTTPKTMNSIRVYPLLKEFEPYIDELKPKTGNPGYVFKAFQANAIVEGQSSIRRKNAVYAKKAGLKVIKLHEFRHSCVSNLLASGLSVRVVSRWVGDTERMVQETYSHLLPSEKDVIKEFFDNHSDLSSTVSIQ